MRAALSLAARHLGQTWPNPAVGCVIVDAAGHVVGRGSTQPGGRPHAETEALAMAGAHAKGGTAYVTLEPCAHHGRTAPCAEALIAAGIRRCVTSLEDPDPRVSGRGHVLLRAAGIEVQTGLLQAEAAALNAGFLKRVREGLPLISLKLATSADGRSATQAGDSKWITGPAARAFGHRLRATHDAIAVGSGTVLADDPELTCRLPGLENRSPIRVVFDRRGRTPSGARLLAPGGPPTWVVTGQTSLIQAINDPHQAIEVAAKSGSGTWLQAACRSLAERGITRLLVEGGATLATAFLEAGLVDRIYWFRAPLVIGGDGMAGVGPLSVERLTQALGFRRADLRPLENDVLELYVRPA